MYKYSDYLASADFIKSKIGDLKPQVVLILGSGLSFLADEVEDKVVIPYADIPNFVVSTAPDHAGELVIGRMKDVVVMMMNGRFHYYEGYTPEEIVFPIRVAAVLGVKSLLLTNACGAVNYDFNVGDIMVINDHIKLIGDSPLRGANIPEFGERFCDMTYTYSPAFIKRAEITAEMLDIPLKKGVYFYFAGPQYETPAEIRAARVLGGDVVGMSTVYEAIAASHLGMNVLGFSLITNMAAGMNPEKLSSDEVLLAANAARGRFSRLVLGCLDFLGE